MKIFEIKNFLRQMILCQSIRTARYLLYKLATFLFSKISRENARISKRVFPSFRSSYLEKGNLS